LRYIAFQLYSALVSHAAVLIREARSRAGITQAELARRLGTTQSAVARLERWNANPTAHTLERALEVTGHRLELAERPWSSVDESQIARQLRFTPAERLEAFERSYADVREIALAARKSLG
jgi:transcriptional regulator with XRE-family HTH domain